MSFPLQVKWRNIHFVMWDIGGQESLRQAWSTYYTGTHFLLLVVDSTDRERLAIAKEELYRMLGHEVRSEELQIGLGDVDQPFSATAPQARLPVSIIYIKGVHIHLLTALSKYSCFYNSCFPRSCYFFERK